MLGRLVADLVGIPLVDLVHPDERHHVIAALDKLVESPGTAANLECRLQHADGSWRDTESICTDLSDDPRVGGLVLNIRDVTV